MKLVKSLLLGSVAGLAAVAGAQAADLPAKKAAPAEYVRVCSTYGAGFFVIPGTETCLKVGGRVRADYVYGEPLDRSDDAIGFRARGRIQLDSRTATAYGLLRAFVRFEITRSSGTPITGVDGAIRTSPDVAQAFVQFGGLTAGRVTSFFDNSDLPTEHMGTLRFSDAPDVDLLAYTFSFGNGFSASIAIEDGLERRVNGFSVEGINSVAMAYAGQRMPDAVANLKYSGTWGSAQLSGAVHQLRSDNVVTPFAMPPETYPDTDYGYAVSAQVGINLPMLAPGDAMWFAATYANGALGYLGFGDNAGIGEVNADVADAYVNPITGDIRTGSGWSIAGGLTHYWTPQIRQSVFGSYARVEYGNGAAYLDPATGLYSGLNNFNEWRVGTNAFWQPVAGLDIGVEVMYAQVDPRGRVIRANGQTIGSESAWEGRLRIQRDF